MMIWLLKQYQRWISPFLPMVCRFHPNCSEYARECFERYSPLKATYFSLKRLFRCHPYCEGGIDLIPGVRRQDSEVRS